MNKSNAKDYLPLVQALADGKVVQMYNEVSGEWVDLGDGEIGLSLAPDLYRIKPEPKEIWVNEGGGLGNCFFESESEAVMHSKRYSIGLRLVRYREVTE